MIADALSSQRNDAGPTTITAVDVSSERLKVARNIMAKYGLAVSEGADAARSDGAAGDDGDDACSPTTGGASGDDPGSGAAAHRAPPVRMFCADGTQFNEPPPSSLAPGQTEKGAGPRAGRADNVPPLCCLPPPVGRLYSRVLVDAECTHDGSVKHVAKFATQWGWSTFERRVLAPEKIEQVTGLQRALLWNGFR